MALLRLGFDVTYDDGVVVSGVAEPADIIKFEDKFNVSAFAALANPTQKQLMYLGFLAMVRANKMDGHDARALPASFEAFTEQVADLEYRAKADDPKGSATGK